MNLRLDKIHETGSIPPEKIGYVALVASYQKRWVIVRIKNSSTWEFPGGTIESEEKPIDAAKRELYEETGAVHADFIEMAEYSAVCDEKYSYGVIYYVEILKLEKLPDFEIAEIRCTNNFPFGNTRYPNIQPAIFSFVASKISLDT